MKEWKGVAIGVFATVLVGGWFWWMDRSIRELSVRTEVRAAQVIDVHALSPMLTIQRTSGEKIESSVYLSQIRLWNSGTETLSKDDRREPTVLQVSGASEIFDVFVDRKARQVDAIDIGVVDLVDSLKWNIEVDWDILDPFPDGSGGIISIIHSGPDIEIVPKGIIARAQVKNVAYDEKIRRFNRKLYSYGLPLLMLMIIPIGIMEEQREGDRVGRSRLSIWLRSVATVIIGVVLAIVMHLLMIWVTGIHDPPVF